MQLVNNLEIIDNAKINEDIFSALCSNMIQVGTSAKEAGEALRRLSIYLYNKDKLETSNQNADFNFLKQNAYKEVNSEWLTPLDSI